MSECVLIAQGDAIFWHCRTSINIRTHVHSRNEFRYDRRVVLIDPIQCLVVPNGAISSSSLPSTSIPTIALQQRGSSVGGAYPKMAENTGTLGACVRLL